MRWGQTGEVVLGRRQNLWSALCLSPWLLFTKDTELPGFAVYKLQETASTGLRAEPTMKGTAGAAEKAENQAHPLHPSLSQAAPPCPFWGQTDSHDVGRGLTAAIPTVPVCGVDPKLSPPVSHNVIRAYSGIFFFKPLFFPHDTLLSSPTRD